jgi:hypothetical protein
VRVGRLLKPAVVCALAAIVGTSALFGAQARANSCNITTDRSPPGQPAATSINFVNQSSQSLDLYWLNGDGQRVYYFTLARSNSVLQQTFVGHPWVLVDSGGVCRGYVIAQSQAITYTITDDPVVTPTPTRSPTPTPTGSPTPTPLATTAPTPQPLADPDNDGLTGTADACPTSPRGAFDADRDGCPGPYRRIAATLNLAWVVEDSGVSLSVPRLKPVPVGATVRLTCRPCHVAQTLTATKRVVSLSKLNGRKLGRGRSFTIMITTAGYVGQITTYTVKPYGHSRAELRRVARAPFRHTRRCIPIGSDKPAKTCSTRPPTGP